MTPPLVPATLDLRDFPFLPVDVVRLVDSDLAAISTGDEFKAAVILWCKAWHQVPASSLPDDDRMLAHLAGFGRDLKGWQKVKDTALRHFVKCSDGRLYHPVIADKAIEAGEAKRKQRERTEAATRARVQKNARRDEQHNDDRDEERHDPRDEQRNDERNVHQGTGTVEGTGNSKKESASTLLGAVETWNGLSDLGIPTVQHLSDTRKKALAKRLDEVGGLDGWAVMVGKIRASPFLRGDKAAWKVTFDWVLKPANLTKIMEGNYDPDTGSGVPLDELVARAVDRWNGQGDPDAGHDRAGDGSHQADQPR